MAAVVVVFRHNIEQKGFYVVVERLGTQEQFGEQTQVLTIHRVLSAINFEERVLAIPVDFIARRVFSRTFELCMLAKT